jgi:hypothetical protein
MLVTHWRQVCVSISPRRRRNRALGVVAPLLRLRAIDGRIGIGVFHFLFFHFT